MTEEAAQPMVSFEHAYESGRLKCIFEIGMTIHHFEFRPEA
ncbi:hypothetical protein M2131_000844 [Polynucleobacter sphagniphilus]|nr:hypothetical protein [Polynucleobacter sphagniphilus]MDH6420903.1 hypothetical protein [Polynucleobacter sphagniphilus]